MPEFDSSPTVGDDTSRAGHLLVVQQLRHKDETMSRTPNDDRSDSMNPNNDAYEHAQDNRSDQLNPNNERYQGDSDDE